MIFKGPQSINNSILKKYIRETGSIPATHISKPQPHIYDKN